LQHLPFEKVKLF